MCNADCYTFYTVYRLGYALALYHIIQAIALIGVEDGSNSRTIIQDGFWPAKLLLLAVLAVGSLWIPYWLIDYMFYPTVLFGFLFVCVQGVLLVDLAFNWAESMLEGASEGGAIYQYLIIGSTGILNLAIIGVTVSVYLYFERNLERTLMTVTALILILMSVCSALPSVQEKSPSSGIFQSAVLGLFSLLIITSAFISNPTLPKLGTSVSTSFPVLSKIVSAFNIVFAYLAVAQASFSNTSSISRLTSDQEDTDSDDTAEYHYTLFHLIFAFAAVYTVLYSTYWQCSNTAGKIVESVFGFWTRVVASWFDGLLYIWILFAPIILQDPLF